MLYAVLLDAFVRRLARLARLRMLISRCLFIRVWRTTLTSIKIVLHSNISIALLQWRRALRFRHTHTAHSWYFSFMYFSLRLHVRCVYIYMQKHAPIDQKVPSWFWQFSAPSFFRSFNSTFHLIIVITCIIFCIDWNRHVEFCGFMLSVSVGCTQWFFFLSYP